MKYRFGDSRQVQARGCLIELEEVLKKWNFRLVPSIHPFITRGYEQGKGTVLDLSEGYEDEPQRKTD